MRPPDSRCWDSGKRRRGATLQADTAVIHQHIAKVIIESERFGVVLSDFNELRLYVDLRSRRIQHLNGLFDNIEVRQ